jgi:hypothetical protein
MYKHAVLDDLALVRSPDFYKLLIKIPLNTSHFWGLSLVYTRVFLITTPPRF